MTKLTNGQVIEGANLSIKNAQELYSVAEGLGKDGSYGLASSLMVLSAEESIKAFGMLGRGVYEKKWGSDLKKFFRSHKHKHDNAGFFLVMCNFMEEIIQEIEDIENDPNITPEECKAVIIKKFQASILEKLKNSDEKFISIVNWQVSADDIKKQGFYVDFSNEKWNSPNSVTENTYIQYRDIALNLLRKMQHGIENVSIEELEKSYSKI